MRYYKIILSNKFIGIGSTIDLRRFQNKNQIFLACDESEAEYIQCNSKLYHAMWMLSATIAKDKYLVADVKEITEQEYGILYNAIMSNEAINEPECVEEEEHVDIDDNTKITLDYVKDAKMKEMNLECNKVIAAGFDEELSDGNTHHFSLTLQDQLNLITSSQTILDGATEIPYHADGELCKYYSREDMEKIIAGANSFKTYHIAYFNSLKTYINSLNDIDKISSISYGVEVPQKYQSIVYSSLIK